jgi:hypothetical protein
LERVDAAVQQRHWNEAVDLLEQHLHQDATSLRARIRLAQVLEAQHTSSGGNSLGRSLPQATQTTGDGASPLAQAVKHRRAVLDRLLALSDDALHGKFHHL